MQILRYCSPDPDRKDVSATALSLVADRLVAVRHGQALRLYDLRAPDEPLAHITDVVQHALQPDALLISDAAGRLSRYEPSHGAWRRVAELPWPAELSGRPIPGAPPSARLLLSPSARYLVVESAPILREPGTWPVAHAYLLDARSGEVQYDVPLHKTYVRASFCVLPTGEQVLFISAPSYMGVQIVACGSGQLLHEYQPEREAFCHTDYALSADSRRLITFGCFWAVPYEARIYDATPWTEGAPAAADFPLPLVYRQMDQFDGDSILPIQPRETTDGAVTCVALMNLAHGYPRGSAEEAELRAQLDGTDRKIFDALRELPATAGALVIRRVDPGSGELVGWSVHEIGQTAERHVHTLSHHRVLVVNDRVQIADALANVVTDYGPAEVAAGWFDSAATTDGQALVIWQAE
jgi:hypothetical protein